MKKALYGTLNEHQCRHFAAVEAKSLGHGGIKAVNEVFRLSVLTIRKGIQESARGEQLSGGRGGYAAWHLRCAENFRLFETGLSHDTSAFVCDNLAHFWQSELQWHYSEAEWLMLLCDGGRGQIMLDATSSSKTCGNLPKPWT